MSVGAWEPEKGSTKDQDSASAEIDRDLLHRLISAVQSPEPLRDSLQQDDRQATELMRLPAQRWLDESEHWDGEQLWALIQFFTLAEMQLPGWDAGAESPVMPLAKALRQRKTPLSREQLLWIKQNSDNRYLPYGPL